MCVAEPVEGFEFVKKHQNLAFGDKFLIFGMVLGMGIHLFPREFTGARVGCATHPVEVASHSVTLLRL